MTHIFLHIPKTAGTTLRTLVLEQFGSGQVMEVYPGESAYVQPRDVLAMPMSTVMNKRFVFGHFDHDFARRLAGAAVKLATMLRSPIPRAISLYRHFMIHHLRRSDLSLSAALTTPVTEQLFNDQTRRISGLQLPAGAGPDSFLAIACANLARDYAYVGFTEAMAQHPKKEVEPLGLKSSRARRVNVTPARPLPELTFEDIQAAARANRLDIGLYRFALALRRRIERGEAIDSAWLAEVLAQPGKAGSAVGSLDTIAGEHAVGWCRNQADTVPEQILLTRNNTGAVVVVAATAERSGVARKGLHPTGLCGFRSDVSSLLEGARTGDRIHAYSLSDFSELRNSPKEL